MLCRTSHRGDTYVGGAVDAGTPVPLLVGNEWMPRHYVLLVGHSGDSVTVYDPGDGKVSSLPIAGLTDGQEKDAYGNWTELYQSYAPTR